MHGGACTHLACADCAAPPACQLLPPPPAPSLEQHYAWFLPAWHSYNETVLRGDAIRYFILHRYGGLYIDLDVECLRYAVPVHRAAWQENLHSVGTPAGSSRAGWGG